MFKKVKSERGFGLIEVLMALALLGIIAVTFLAAINVASRAILIADERTTAESLAKSQMEAIKEQDYIEDVTVGDEVYAIYYGIDTSVEHPSFNIGSIITIDEVEVAMEDIIGIPWDSGDGEAASSDDGLQRVKLIVCNNGEDGVSLEDYVIILEDFKVDR
ncbi:prepilin-type N-terminal cleavage/methylation domain-containing protein [Chloroflexota bacterium]